VAIRRASKRREDAAATRSGIRRFIAPAILAFGFVLHFHLARCKLLHLLELKSDEGREGRKGSTKEQDGVGVKIVQNGFGFVLHFYLLRIRRPVAGEGGTRGNGPVGSFCKFFRTRCKALHGGSDPALFSLRVVLRPFVSLVALLFIRAHLLYL
jgi:hypothetical protein